MKAMNKMGLHINVYAPKDSIIMKKWTRSFTENLLLPRATDIFDDTGYIQTKTT